MNKTLKAADEVRKLTRMFQSLGEVVEVLDRIGSVEQAEGEVQARIDRLNKQAAGIQTEADGIKSAANAYAQEQRERADAVLSAARQDAEALKAEALQIVADAEAKSQALQIAAGKAVAAAEEKVAEAGAVVAAKHAELDDIEKRLEKAQAQVNKLLGG